ncbi:MAG: hypothetical protein WBD22_01345 [Pyrinomonadaceae bacterium]
MPHEKQTERLGAEGFQDGRIARVREMISILSGSVLRRRRDHSRGDPLGTGHNHETCEMLYLFKDGKFRYIKRSFSSIAGVEMSLPSDTEFVAEGSWSVQLHLGQTVLTLEENGTKFASWYSKVGDGGIHYLSKQRWKRSLID